MQSRPLRMLLPEGRQVGCLREAARHADDGDGRALGSRCAGGRLRSRSWLRRGNGWRCGWNHGRRRRDFGVLSDNRGAQPRLGSQLVDQGADSRMRIDGCRRKVRAEGGVETSDPGYGEDGVEPEVEEAASHHGCRPRQSSIPRRGLRRGVRARAPGSRRTPGSLQALFLRQR